MMPHSLQPSLQPLPRLRDVVREQVRTVGLSLRLPAVVAAVLVGLATVLVTAGVLRDGRAIDFHPEHQMLPGMVGLLLPFAVWKGEERFGPGFLWTLPVDRQRHALTRVFAGWAWLMGAVGLFMLWLLALTLLSGGGLLAEEALQVLHAPHTGPGPLEAQSLSVVRWAPQPVLWLVPFTAASGAYVLASAGVLGLRHPLRWVAGTALGLLLLFVVGDVTRVQWLAAVPGRLLEPLLSGPYGFDTLLTARTESLKTEVTLTTGETAVVWSGLPHLGQWAVATALWMGGGLVALWAASARHRERRRR